MEFKINSLRKMRVKRASSYLIDWDGDSRSKFQKRVKDFLREYWKNDVVYEEFPVAGTRQRFDFYNHTKKIVVEASPDQHFKFNKFFHENSRSKFLDQLKRDEKKLAFCNLNDIIFIEVMSDDDLTLEFFANYGAI